ncbi:DUF7718 family protein [Halobium salinum]|uniref:DUF7718 family protein n=1 Tax=Halobium salinum TaxID=1364940 RepID=UPI003CCE5223
MQSEFAYTYEVGVFRHRPYQIGVRADPSLNDVDSFAVVLFFEQKDGIRIEIAKIDNSEHDRGEIHLDQYYRSDPTKKDFTIEVDSVYEADDFLEQNWLRYAQLYDRNHGTSAVT